MRYFYLEADGQTVLGPHAKSEMRNIWVSRNLPGSTLCAREGSEDWQSLDQMVDELYSPDAEDQTNVCSAPQAVGPRARKESANLFIETPSPAQAPVAFAPESHCSRGVYIILGLFLGFLGIHNFYAGRVKEAVTELLAFILLFWTIVVPLVIGVWVIFELCTVTTDGKGRMLK